jgi:hypothetical protein
MVRAASSCALLRSTTGRRSPGPGAAGGPGGAEGVDLAVLAGVDDPVGHRGDEAPLRLAAVHKGAQVTGVLEHPVVPAALKA